MCVFGVLFRAAEGDERRARQAQTTLQTGMTGSSVTVVFTGRSAAMMDRATTTTTLFDNQTLAYASELTFATETQADFEGESISPCGTKQTTRAIRQYTPVPISEPHLTRVLSDILMNY